MITGYPQVNNTAITYWAMMADNITDNVTAAGLVGEGPNLDSRGHINWAVLGFLSMVLTSLTSNGLIIVTVQYSPRLHSMFYYILSSLAVSDILTALLVLPVAVARTLLDRFPLPVMYCKAWQTLLMLFAASTLVHMLVATIHSHLMLSVPLQYRQCSRVSSILIQLTVAWVTPILLVVPTIVTFTMDHFDDSIVHWGCGPLSLSYILCSLLPTFYLPLLLMIMAYVKVTFKVKQQNRIAIRLQHESSTYKNGFAHAFSDDLGQDSLVTDTAIKDKTQMLIAAITRDTAKDKQEPADDFSIQSTSNQKTFDDTSNCSLSTYNLSKSEGQSDFECHSVASGTSDNGSVSEGTEQSPTQDKNHEKFVFDKVDDKPQDTKPESSIVLNTRTELSPQPLPPEQVDNKQVNGESSANGSDNDGETKPKSSIKGSTRKGYTIVNVKRTSSVRKITNDIPSQKEDECQRNSPVKEHKGYTIVRVTSIKKPKAGKEQLNGPVDNNDIQVMLEPTQLSDTDQLLQGLDNPAYDLTDENPLAESIKPKRHADHEDGNNKGREMTLDDQTLVEGNCAPQGHSRDSSLETGGGIDGPRRSILRRDGSKRSSQKIVKFDLPEGEIPKKKNSKIQRRPTGIKRDSRGRNNHLQRQKVTRLNHSHSKNDNSIANGKVPISKSKGKGYHHQNGSLKSSPNEYMAQVQRNHGLRLSSKVRSQKAHVQLLCVMFITYVILSLPYFVTYTVLSICPSCRISIDRMVMIVFEWLFHASSTVNLLIYMACSSEFRIALLLMVGCKG